MTDDVAAGTDLLEDLLQPLLEVTAVAAARHQRAEVEGVQLLVLERLRHLALDDRLGQAFHDGGLADARLAHEDGVVLGPARQDLHDPLDLLLATDDWVELSLARGLSEVATELVEHQRRRRRAFGRAATRRRVALALVAGQQLNDLLPNAVEVGPELDQHLGSDTLALANESQQDVLGADVVVAELQRLTKRQLENLLRARGERNVPGRRLLALADDLLDLTANCLERDAEALQRLRRDALTLVDQPQQDVLGADVVVVEHPGFFLSQDDYPPRAVGESLEHVAPHRAVGQEVRAAGSLSFRMLAPGLRALMCLICRTAVTQVKTALSWWSNCPWIRRVPGWR